MNDNIIVIYTPLSVSYRSYCISAYNKCLTFGGDMESGSVSLLRSRLALSESRQIRLQICALFTHSNPKNKYNHGVRFPKSRQSNHRIYNVFMLMMMIMLMI